MLTFQELSINELKTKITNNIQIVIIDVREEEDYEEEHIPNAIHIDQYNINEFIANTEKETPLVICCYRGNRSKKWAMRFIQNGFTEVYNLTGGFTAWNENT